MALEKKEEWKTIADMEALPEGTRVELIDGKMYDMAAPTVVHQDIVSFLVTEINLYIRSKGGKCKVFPSPFDVQLDKDEYTLVQPDVSVICDRSKLSGGKRCVGAPDWVVEVVSPATGKNDYSSKFYKYRAAGVREYWIIDPDEEKISTFNFTEWTFKTYSIDEKPAVKVGIYPDLVIDFSMLEI